MVEINNTVWIIAIVVLASLSIGGTLLWLALSRPGRPEILWSLLCQLPAGGLVLFYSFVLRARFELQQWPAPYRPDPKDLAFPLHHGAVWLSFPVVVASLVTFLVVVLARGRRYGHLWKSRIFAAGYVLTLAAWFLILRTDPGHFVEWFVD